MVLGALWGIGCTADSPGPQDPVGPAREAGIVAAVITATAELAEDPEELPVVYVVGDQGTPDIEVQASVATLLQGSADLRFADEDAEAFEEVDGVSRLREGAMLLVIGEVPAEGDEVEVTVTRHRDPDLVEELRVTLVRSDLAWIAADVSAVAAVG